MLNLFKLFRRVLRLSSRPKRKTKHFKKTAAKKSIKIRRKPARKKKITKKTARVPVKRKKPGSIKKTEIKFREAGVVTHYFPKVKAAVLQLKKPLLIGSPVWFKGNTTDFRQTVASMQIDRLPIEKARAGQEVGIEVLSEVRPGDKIFILESAGRG